MGTAVIRNALLLSHSELWEKMEIAEHDKELAQRKIDLILEGKGIELRLEMTPAEVEAYCNAEAAARDVVGYSELYESHVQAVDAVFDNVMEIFKSDFPDDAKIIENLFEVNNRIIYRKKILDILAKLGK